MKASSWLGLRGQEVPKDLRKFLYDKLDLVDRGIVWVAHVPARASAVYRDLVFQASCAERGYLWPLKRAGHDLIKMSETCSLAAGGGHLHVLKWVRLKGFPWDERTAAHAAEGGHIHVLDWIAQTDSSFPWNNASMCKYAIGGGNLCSLQWLHHREREWFLMNRREICVTMIDNGHVHMLQWLMDNHMCVLDDEVLCGRAAYKGHLPMLQWLRANGCPWNAGVIYMAVLYERVVMVQWALSNGCPVDLEKCISVANSPTRELLLSIKGLT
jgi:hypothetical protein